jgi:UDP-N-acetylglucosamine--dolichyl-phosphate N-acetylglucosaminephosphotransferase
MFLLFLIFIIGFTSVYFSVPVLIKLFTKRGILGIDIHKKERPLIPEMGGLAIIFGLFFQFITVLLIIPEKFLLFLNFFSVILIAGLIGAIDDLKPLNAKVKPFLTTFACIPLLILGSYIPSIVFPIIGGTRLTRVYPILIPLVMSVTSNAVNMMDPFNGVMAGTCSIATIAIMVSALIMGKGDALFLSLSLFSVLIAFFYYNRYPSKVFSGDVGSLSVGAALGSIAILGQVEIIMVIAFMPQIMNAFYGLSSVGRLYERREVSRPIKILDDGRLMASPDKKAPLTLARLILARGPLHEFEASFVFMVISAISGLLAIITAIILVLTT